jgi:signal peptidase I
MRRGEGGRIRKRGLGAAAFGATTIGAAVLGGATRRFAIVDDSMRPTLQPDDWVIARRRRDMPARGDIVIFTHPSYPDWTLVKRVIGLPGERITVAGGQIHIDDRVLAEPWADEPLYPESRDDVPDDSIWLMADRRAVSSVDSRVLGPIPIEDVGWTVVARYWPPRRAGRV